MLGGIRAASGRMPAILFLSSTRALRLVIWLREGGIPPARWKLI